MPSSTTRSPRNLRIAAGLMAVGALCPWASLLGLASVNGLSVTFGWVSFLAGLAILTLSLDPNWLERVDWVRGQRRRITITLAVLSALACLLVIIGISQTAYAGAFQAAWGCYLTLIASIAAGVCAPTGPATGETRR